MASMLSILMIFFTYPNLSTTRGHPLKLATPIAKKDVRKYFFSTRIIPIWNALLSDFVMVNSTKKFKKLISTLDLSEFSKFASYFPD